MIWDCFIFFNELELLDLRLNELHDAVDKFVLVEATRTFSGLEKPLYFQENVNRFQKFRRKIVHIVVRDMPIGDRWSAEDHQRDAILQGLKEAQAGDVILISDVDEIWNKRIGVKFGCYCQRLFYYYLNITFPLEWKGTVCLQRRDVMLPSLIRANRASLPLIDNGGWHFSFLGGPQRIREKIEAFSHSEYDDEYYKGKIAQNVESLGDIFERTHQKLRAISINEDFPLYLQENQEKFKDLIYRRSDSLDPLM